MEVWVDEREGEGVGLTTAGYRILSQDAPGYHY